MSSPIITEIIECLPNARRPCSKGIGVRSDTGYMASGKVPPAAPSITEAAVPTLQGQRGGSMDIVANGLTKWLPSLLPLSDFHPWKARSSGLLESP